MSDNKRPSLKLKWDFPEVLKEVTRNKAFDPIEIVISGGAIQSGKTATLVKCSAERQEPIVVGSKENQTKIIQLAESFADYHCSVCLRHHSCFINSYCYCGNSVGGATVRKKTLEEYRNRWEKNHPEKQRYIFEFFERLGLPFNGGTDLNV